MTFGTVRDVSMVILCSISQLRIMLRSQNSAVMFIWHLQQNVSISLRLSYSVQCRRGCYFQAWALYFSFGTYCDVNIKHLCSPSMYEHN